MFGNRSQGYEAERPRWMLQFKEMLDGYNSLNDLILEKAEEAKKKTDDLLQRIEQIENSRKASAEFQAKGIKKMQEQIDGMEKILTALKNSHNEYVLPFIEKMESSQEEEGNEKADS